MFSLHAYLVYTFARVFRIYTSWGSRLTAVSYNTTWQINLEYALIYFSRSIYKIHQFISTFGIKKTEKKELLALYLFCVGFFRSSYRAFHARPSTRPQQFSFSFFFSSFSPLWPPVPSPLSSWWPPVAPVVVVVVDHSEGPASSKWSSRGTSLLQMIILRGRLLANDHPEGPASCKCSSWGAGLLQMTIWRDRPLANDHMSPLSLKELSSIQKKV